MIETYYRILIHDPAGRLVKDTGLVPSRSYVINFLKLMESYIGVRDKSGTDVTGAESVIKDGYPDTAQSHGRVDAAVGDDTHGIVVGTNAGASAEDNEDYNLDTKILHSAVGEANKMNYRAVTFVKARVVGVNVDLDVTRVFLNETGSTITVKEIGIIIMNNVDTKYHLILRDVVTDEPVEAAYTLTVVYTLRTTA